MQAKPTGARSSRIDHDSKTSVPADAKLRPLGDQIIVEPLNVVLSSIIVTHEDTKPLRGIVKAVGPGHYPKVYDHPDKHRRTRMWDSAVFQPTELEVGDVVELGGHGHQGYAFQTFYWGDVKHLFCREADVSGIVDGQTVEQARAQSQAATV
jgi:co-chaperonin GroES (HSP10)